jgi:hypothetical protein
VRKPSAIYRWALLALSVIAWPIMTDGYQFLTGPWTRVGVTNTSSLGWIRVESLVTLVFPFSSAVSWRYDWTGQIPEAPFWAVVMLGPLVLGAAYLLLTHGRTWRDALPFTGLLATWVAVSIVFAMTFGGLLSPLFLAFQGPIAPTWPQAIGRTIGRLLVATPYVVGWLLLGAPWLAAVLVRLIPRGSGEAPTTVVGE